MSNIMITENSNDNLILHTSPNKKLGTPLSPQFKDYLEENMYSSKSVQ